jgi:outer membrane protein OmpA-like peptidoglycan-associated protein
MNAFGARRFAFRQIAILCCFASMTWGQDEPPATTGQEVKPPPVGLIYQSLDLKYTVEDLSGGAENLKGKNESTGGGAIALKNEVVDLVAKGIDVKETESEIKINLLGDILFDFDKADIRPVAEPTLAAIAKLIQGRKNPKVLIEGHTDSKGSVSYNAKLSDRRAVSVKSWFAQHGVAANSMQTQGWGASKPVAPNTHPDGSDDPGGRQKNRRVEITIKK